MIRSEIVTLLPYLASLGISLGLFLYVAGKRSAKGAFAFSWYLLAQALWLAGFVFGLVSENLLSKILWSDLKWFASAIAIVALPVFAVQYAERTVKRKKLLFGLTLIVPCLLVVCLVSDLFFGCLHKSPAVSPLPHFSELTYELPYFAYAYAFYAYGVGVWSVSLLAARFLHRQNLYRVQTLILAASISIPVFGTLLPLLGIRVIAALDPMPLTAALGNLALILGLARFRVFEVAPIGRDKVFEAMEDPVVILDNNLLVSDANNAMLSLLGKKADEVIGRKAKEIFDGFPIPIKRYLQASYARAEANFTLRGVEVNYEMTVWPIYNERKEMTGRIYISRDVTAQKELEGELRKLNAELEDRVRARTWELAEAYDTTLEGWARALELRDEETEGHSRRVTELTLKIAHALRLSDEEIEHIRRGAVLHDIGKMSVPDEILHKEGKLTDEERKIIQQHPVTAYNLLSPISFLRKALEIPYSHHEKWDGTGYPQGLKGEEIPLAARIFAAADVWDALSSDRRYNRAWEREKIIAYFREQSGKHFDPVVVNTLFKLLEQGEI